MERIRSAATPFLSEVNVSNISKLTGQMNCLHINSNLRFVSNVFLHCKRLLRRGHNVAKGHWIFFIVAKNLMNKR